MNMVSQGRMQRRRLLIAGTTASLVPALALARTPLAKVLGRTIYSDETTQPGRGLDGQILRPLMQRFAEQERLTASDAEVAELESALKLPPPPPGLSDADKAMRRELPRDLRRRRAQALLRLLRQAADHGGAEGEGEPRGAVVAEVS